MPDPSSSRPSVTRDRDDHALYGKLKPGPGLSRQRVQQHQQARLRGAMVEAVAGYGFEGVTVRRLTGLAGVSTKTFYRHFSGVEDCFASTYETLTSRMLIRAAAARPARIKSESLAAVFESLLADFGQHPQEARLILVEAYAAGPLARSKISWLEGALSHLIGADLLLEEEPGATPQAPAGVSAALLRIGRTLIDSDRGASPRLLGPALARLTMSSAARDRRAEVLKADRGTEMQTSSHDREPLLNELESTTDDRSRLRAAAARLSLADGPTGLTPAGLCAQAGVARRVFDREFGDPTTCLLDLAEEVAVFTATRAWRGGRQGQSGPDDVMAMAAALCDELGRNPLMARLCWTQIPLLGRDGLTATDRLISLVAATMAKRKARSRGSGLLLEAALAGLWASASRLVDTGRFQDLRESVPSLLRPILAAMR